MEVQMYFFVCFVLFFHHQNLQGYLQALHKAL